MKFSCRSPTFHAFAPQQHCLTYLAHVVCHLSTHPTKPVHLSKKTYPFHSSCQLWTHLRISCHQANSTHLNPPFCCFSTNQCTAFGLARCRCRCPQFCSSRNHLDIVIRQSFSGIHCASYPTHKCLETDHHQAMIQHHGHGAYHQASYQHTLNRWGECRLRTRLIYLTSILLHKCHPMHDEGNLDQMLRRLWILLRK